MAQEPTPVNKQSPVQPGSKLSTGQKAGGLAAVIGSVAAGILFVSIPADEGVKYKAYKDIVGVWTVCDGDTTHVTPGMVETKQGCQARLEKQLIAHAGPVMACTPSLRGPGRDYQRAAAVSLAYNIGTGAYCKSSIDRFFDVALWKQGCDAFLAYDRAGGRVVPGLLARRQRERTICLKGL